MVSLLLLCADETATVVNPEKTRENEFKAVTVLDGRWVTPKAERKGIDLRLFEQLEMTYTFESYELHPSV